MAALHGGAQLRDDSLQGGPERDWPDAAQWDRIRRTILCQGRGQGQRELGPSVDEAEGSIIVPPATSRPAGSAHAASSCAPADTLETVLANLYELSGEYIDADAPLLESGLDSVGAVELGNQLQQQARAFPPPSSLNTPTPDPACQLADYSLRASTCSSVYACMPMQFASMLYSHAYALDQGVVGCMYIASV